MVPKLALEGLASKLTVWPTVGEAGAIVNAALGAVTRTLFAVPMLVPSAASTVSATVKAPLVGKTRATVGTVVSTGRAGPPKGLNCQLYLDTPPGAVEPVASKLSSRPLPWVAVKVAVARPPLPVTRCRQV